jgi:hypothetical protein
LVACYRDDTSVRTETLLASVECMAGERVDQRRGDPGAASAAAAAGGLRAISMLAVSLG